GGLIIRIPHQGRAVPSERIACFQSATRNPFRKNACGPWSVRTARSHAIRAAKKELTKTATSTPGKPRVRSESGGVTACMRVERVGVRNLKQTQYNAGAVVASGLLQPHGTYAPMARRG